MTLHSEAREALKEMIDSLGMDWQLGYGLTAWFRLSSFSVNSIGFKLSICHLTSKYLWTNNMFPVFAREFPECCGREMTKQYFRMEAEWCSIWGWWAGWSSSGDRHRRIPCPLLQVTRLYISKVNRYSYALHAKYIISSPQTFLSLFQFAFGRRAELVSRRGRTKVLGTRLL